MNNTKKNTNHLSVYDVPAYADIQTYGNILGSLHIWEGDGWKRESMSWKEGVYIASNLSGLPEYTFRGQEAQEFLSRVCINNVYDWPVGRSKHLVSLDENGFIATHGLAVRDGEETFRQFAAVPWLPFQAEKMNMDLSVESRDIFLYQVAGPKSLQVLERFLGQSLRHVDFLDVIHVDVPGVETDVQIELSRIGMAGTLSYELRGPQKDGPAIFDALYRAGQEFDITRLGWRTYVVNHTEGGFAQQGCNFLPAAYINPEFATHPIFGGGVADDDASGPLLPGSVSPSNIRARLRTPHEVKWGWMGKLDHEFIGREAFELEDRNPQRTIVTLRWDPQDLMEVFRSQFETGEEYKMFEFPTTPQSPGGGHADIVTVDNQEIGISSLAVYSYYYREMLSQSIIDVEHAIIGQEVVIHWGDFGKKIKPIRATVERFPYLDLPSNKEYSLDSVPSGVLRPTY